MTMLMTPPQPPAPPRRRRWRLPKLALGVAFTALVGLAVLLYPSAASWYSAVLQAREVDGYQQEVTAIGPVGREKVLAEARSYNSALRSGAVVAANERLPFAHTSAPTTVDYDDLLAADAHGLMARLTIPAIDVDLPIYHGTSERVLEEGIGHLEGTALPVGGEGTHSVLTGHRGLATATLFTHLDRVQVGDRFQIYVFGDVLTYEVTSTIVVEPDETESLNPVPGADQVTLVTCTPLGINSQRILVTGERILPTPPADVRAAAVDAPGPGFPWWAAGLGGAVLILGGYVQRSGRPRVPRQDGPPSAPLPDSTGAAIDRAR
ncbi:class C sortase [Pseudactinotalea sp. HY160]|uniref:class C sortase n=1 Tax=Pseudactinotalea sp. HY160 TaxID=2654490 RepID=UPI001D13B435|nr:class C sortase [Pseudactinotalea sp. HY160]